MPNAFNFAASPFDCLSPDEQRLVRASVDIAYFPEGAVVLVGGDPGIGKSTLLLQALAKMAPALPGLYVTGEESLAQVALDLGGRPFLAYANGVNSSFVRDFDTNLFEEFFRALCVNARMNLHVRVDGNEAHHAIEGVFKGFARALREAIEADPRDAGIPSSKGVL